MKYVLVTGASGGMGNATVNYLINKGYGVFALDISPVNVQGVHYIKTDVTDENSVISAFNEVKSHVEKLYAVIHFAGIYMLDSLVEIKTSDFDRIFAVNFRGAYLINKTFLPLLEKDSRILMTTSELADVSPLPFTGLYAITKSALDRYAFSLKNELQLLGIHVSVLRAGAVKTGMLGVSTQALDKFCNNTSLYKCNARRFKKIVDSVESKCVPPEKVAEKAVKIIERAKPKFAYSINRNGLLRLYNVAPERLKFFAIKKVLKEE